MDSILMGMYAVFRKEHTINEIKFICFVNLSECMACVTVSQIKISVLMKTVSARLRSLYVCYKRIVLIMAIQKLGIALLQICWSVEF